MSVSDAAPSYVRGLAPYQPGKPIGELAREMGLDERNIIKLASNENPLGMSPHARAAAAAELAQGALYPDGNGTLLKEALAAFNGVDTDMLVLGNGSNDVLEMATRAFLTPGSSTVFSQYAFAVYPIATQAAGARPIAVPARAYGHDLDAMRAAITADTRIVFVANPNNPTGTFLAADALEQFIASVPADVLVILDEAYTEFQLPENRYDALAWVARHPNLLVARTFSKVYGLAGLRVGYGVAQPAVIDLLNRVRQPFNVSSMALAAAVAALADQEFVQQSVSMNQRGMVQITEGLDALGCEWMPSAGNFLTFKVGDGAAVDKALLRQGVIVRPLASYGLPEWLRVTIGLPEQNERFLAALGDALTALR